MIPTVNDIAYDWFLATTTPAQAQRDRLVRLSAAERQMLATALQRHLNGRRDAPGDDRAPERPSRAAQSHVHP